MELRGLESPAARLNAGTVPDWQPGCARQIATATLFTAKTMRAGNGWQGWRGSEGWGERERERESGWTVLVARCRTKGTVILARSAVISAPNEKLRVPLAVYTGLDRPLLFTSTAELRGVSPLIAALRHYSIAISVYEIHLRSPGERATRFHLVSSFSRFRCVLPRAGELLRCFGTIGFLATCYWRDARGILENVQVWLVLN